MRVKLIPWIVGICTLGPGCGPTYNTTRTLIVEPFLYCDSADKVVEWTRDEKLAKDAWEKVGASTGQAYSKDYERGFKFGFADYLYAGGSGLPPPMPPRRYWKPKYESAAGYQAVDEWYAGYRHGAAVAMESGFREYVPVHTWVPPMPEGNRLDAARAFGTRPTGPAPEVLPPPKEAEKTTPLPAGAAAPNVRTAAPDLARH
jgi:hypothetical protein